MNRKTLIKPVGMCHEKLKLYLNKFVHLSIYRHYARAQNKQYGAIIPKRILELS